MTDFETVTYIVTDAVATLRLNRPQTLNAFNQRMRLDLHAAVDQANRDPAVRVVVLTGVGRAFSSGADLQESPTHARIGEQIIAEYKPFLMAINDAGKLYIAAINGACAGIGSAVAMACDLAVMADNSFMYQAFAAIGLLPDGGATFHLVRNLGYKKALEVIVQADRIPAQQCLHYGLVNKVVPAAELDASVEAWARQLSKGSPLSQKFTKRALKEAQHASLSDVIDFEAGLQSRAAASEDARNAVSAFFNKERPVFKGE